MWESILFWFCGSLMVLSGLMMVLSRSAVVAACWLILGFLNAAGVFATLAAPFLAVLQVLVYAGAIMVLFLFVIMMLQGPVLEDEMRPPRAWVVLAVMAPAVAIAVGLLAWFRGRTAGAAAGLTPGFGSAEQVSALLLNRYLLAFELISIVLLVAIIGAVALGKRERGLPWQ